MEGTTPKVSFIPKGSLVREESFLERPRPRSTLGLLAIVSVLASIGTFAGLYFYNRSLLAKIETMFVDINKAKEDFSKPLVEKAQLFSSRAELVKELLYDHTVVSPVFDFLSDSTLKSIFYNKFSFVRSMDGAKVELSGEAPSYAALAYQGDVLRGKKELLNFAISDISLTNFGTVTFSMTLTFVPSYLSYVDSFNSAGIIPESPAIDDASPLQGDLPQGGLIVETFTQVATSSVTVTVPSREADAPKETGAVSAGEAAGFDVQKDTAVRMAEENATTSAVAKPSVLRSFWSRFKFW